MYITNLEDDLQKNGTKLNEEKAQMIKSLQQKIIVGSTQVFFLMCTLEIQQKLQHKFLLLIFCYLLLSSLCSNYELILYFRFSAFFHSYESFNHVNFNILDLLWVSCTLSDHISTLSTYRSPFALSSARCHL